MDAITTNLSIQGIVFAILGLACLVFAAVVLCTIRASMREEALLSAKLHRAVVQELRATRIAIVDHATRSLEPLSGAPPTLPEIPTGEVFPGLEASDPEAGVPTVAMAFDRTRLDNTVPSTPEGKGARDVQG